MAAERRKNLIVVLLAVICSLGLATTVGIGALFWQELQQAKADRAALADQVRSLGGKPVVEPKAGDRGRDGPPGPRGLQGIQGRPGRDGITPPCMLVSTHCQGKPGAPGPQGKPGTDGQDGTDGHDGTDGIDGDDGVNGSSAYQIAVDHGFEGTEAEWLASLKGDTGATGATGETGATGPAGRGIVDQACVDDGPTPADGAHWVITYDKEPFTVTLPAGSCRQPIAPHPPA